MNIFFIIFIIAAVTCVLGGIYGAIKSNEGAIGIVANLSIPVFFGCVIACLATPNPPEIWQKVLIIAGVIFVGLIMVVSNRKDNDIMMKRIRGM